MKTATTQENINRVLEAHPNHSEFIELAMYLEFTHDIGRYHAAYEVLDPITGHAREHTPIDKMQRIGFCLPYFDEAFRMFYEDNASAKDVALMLHNKFHFESDGYEGYDYNA